VRLDHVDLGGVGGVERFLETLSPGVFRPIAYENLPAAVTFLLRRFRTVTAEAGGPVAVPIHITETGWPTGGQRTENDQAEVLAVVADAMTASDVGVQACEWFGLRHELTAATWSARFGVLRDDYTAKAAFATLPHIIMAPIAAIT
jgi:hypothetical protein